MKHFSSIRYQGIHLPYKNAHAEYLMRNYLFLYLQLGPVMRRINWFMMFLLVCALLFVCWFAPGTTNKSLALACGLAAAAVFGAWLWSTFRAEIRKPAVA